MGQAGQLVAGIAGAAIGFIVGGPVGAQIGWVAGTALFSLLNPPKQQGPRLNDLTLQRSEYGAMIPWLRGMCRVAGNVIWQTDLVEHEHSEGGKGGGGGSTTYTYSASFAILLCEGPINGIRRIWADGRVIWEGGEATSEVPFTLYLGDATQDPDPTMEADPDIGTGNVPDYRGYAYIVFKDMPLEDYQNRIPNLEFEIEVTGTPTITRVSTFEVTAGYPTAGQGNDGGLTVAPFDGAYIDGSQIVICHYEADYPTSRYVEYRRNLFTGALEETSATLDVENVEGTSQYDYIYSSNSDIAYGLKRGGALHPSRWYVAGVRGSDYVLPPVGTDEYRACVSRPVKWEGYVYGVGGNSTGTVTFVAKWPLDGGTVSGTPASEYHDIFGNQSGSSTSIAAANCSVSIGSDGYLYVINPTLNGVATWYDLTKVDPSDMSMVKQWTIDPTETRIYSAMAQGVNSNSQIAVVRGLLVVNDLSTSPDSLGLWIIPEDVNDPFVEVDTAKVDNTAYFSGTSPLVWLTGGYVLGNDGVYYISALDDLASVNAAICEWGERGLSSSLYDVTDLAGIPVRGFKLGNVMSKKNAIEELRKAFPYGVAEIDGRAVFRLLNHDPDGAVDDADLAAFQAGNAPPSKIRWEITNDLELPRRVTFRFPNADRDYQVDTAEALADNGIATAEPVLDIAVVMTKAEGETLAQQYMSRAYLERQSATFTVPRPYLTMAPLDVWTVDGNTIRIETTKWAPGDAIEVTGKLAAAALFELGSISTATGTGSGNTGAGTTTRKPLSPTESVLLDIPLLLPTHSLFGFYWAAGPTNSALRWPGAVLYRSRDDGTTYEVAATKTTPDIIGVTTDTLGDYVGDLTVPDTSNTVTVRLTRSDAELTTITDDALANGSNLCAIRTTGGWELLQFRDATLVDPQTYELSHLMRGRLETDANIPDHADGDTFVLLPVTNVDAPESDLNVPLLYKAVTMGAAFDSASWVEFTNTGEGANSGGGGIVRHLPVLFVFHNDDYTFVESDRGKWHVFDGSANITATLPAGLRDGWWCYVENVGANDVTLDPANNLDGDTTSLTLTTAQGVILATDATDYYSLRGVSSGGGGGSSITVKDQGSTLTTALTSLDFLGASITAAHLGGGAVAVTVVQTIHTLDTGVTIDADADSINANAPISMSDAGGGVTNLTLDDDGITNAKLRNSAGLSVIGRGANSTGDPADIVAANDGDVLRRSGTTLAFGPLSTAGLQGIAASFSNGQDGNLTISSGTTTLTRDMYYDTVTISGTARIDPAGWTIYAKVIDLTNAPAGAISRTSNAGNNATNQTGATGGASQSTQTAGGGQAGTPGGGGGSGAGTNSAAPTALSGNGGIGGAGGAAGNGSSGSGAAGGASTTPTPQRVGTLRAPCFFQSGGATWQPTTPFGGSGGRGGAGASGNGANAGGGGGGGGQGGANVVIYADEIIVGPSTAAGAISGKGGRGGNGANGQGAANTGGGGGAGGGGGGWGYFVFGKVTGTASNVIDFSGGDGGNGGTATTGGTNGTGGVGGDGGNVELFVGSGATAAHTTGSSGGSASGTTGGTGGPCLVSL